MSKQEKLSKSNINISKEIKDDILIFRLKGRLDTINSPKIQEQILNHLANGHTKILLNFGGIEYISSAGIKVLLSLNQKIKELHGTLMISSAAPEILEIINLTGLLQYLTIAKNEDEALKKM